MVKKIQRKGRVKAQVSQASYRLFAKKKVAKKAKKRLMPGVIDPTKKRLTAEGWLMIRGRV